MSIKMLYHLRSERMALRREYQSLLIEMMETYCEGRKAFEDSAVLADLGNKIEQARTILNRLDNEIVGINTTIESVYSQDKML